MSKDKLSDYDGTTAGNNTDIGGISIAEGMLPSAVNNSMRELTRQLGAFANGTEAVAQISFGDNAKAVFGASSDLQIFHDGSSSYVKDNGSGNLVIDTNGAGTYLMHGSEIMASFVADGAVGLRHDNSEKLATTSTGIDVTGTVTADGILNNNKSEFFASEAALVSTGSTAKVYATNSTFDGVNGSLVLQSRPTSGADVYIATGSTPKTVAKFNDGGDISFYASDGTTQGLFWDASTQRLGLGTTGPGAGLEVEDANGIIVSRSGYSQYLQLQPANNSVPTILGVGGNGVHLGPTSTTGIRVNSGGDVGIGTSSPSGKAEIYKSSVNSAIIGTSYNGHYFESQSDDATDAFEIYQKHGSNTTRNSFIVNDNRTGSKSAAFLVRGDGNIGIGTSSPVSQMTLGGTSDLVFTQNGYGIAWGGDNGSPKIFGTSGGALSFKHGGGSTAVTIDTSGNLLVGSTSFAEDGSTNSIKINPHEILTGTTSTAANTHLGFSNPNGRVGSIVTNGSSTAFNTSSDHRLKENVADMTGAIDRVKALAPKRFNFIADADTTVDGFLAHEAQAVVPEAVTGTHNEVDEDGNAVMQGIDQSKLVPLLTAALKESIAKIEDLETRLAALEGA